MKLLEVNYDQLSPMMKQYYDIKKNYSDILLFYRLGDFYELFFEDAEIVSRELGLTLTGKNAGLKERIPMCGAPHHSIKNYVKEALNKGYKVAICEQMEDPKTAKGMVKREVTEVISKGTMTDLEFLDNKEPNYIGSVIIFPNSYLITYADISTGELNSLSILKEDNKLLSTIINNNFKEIIVTESFDTNLKNILTNNYNIDVTYVNKFLEEDLPFLNSIVDLKIKKGIKHLLYYLKIEELKDISHFDKVNILNDKEYLNMDIHTIRNLELFETLRMKERHNSLIWLIDRCKTAMGSRKLKSWMLKPLRNREKIEDRLNKIETLNNNFIVRTELSNYLYKVYDIERLCGKIASGSANARDILQLNNSLIVLPNIKNLVSTLNFNYNIETFKEISNKISSIINEDAPITLKEGNLIKTGYCTELDELRNIRHGGKQFISEIVKEAQEKTGINNLKVGYNKVFGYFIEVTKGNVDKIPDNLGWERKQTLTNAERYISPELKEKENLILNAEEKIIDIEYTIFINLRNEIKELIHNLLDTANVISEIDALSSLSIISEDLKFVKPKINMDHQVKIINGRHPVVEHVSKIEYVPNNIIMDNSVNTLLITGPNMSGKSTYMREFAIIVILAQMGSYVPADVCEIPIFDSIFTRIGASDDLVSGESTFMVEMKEANHAIQNATENSLILFDELGRGTATYDGMSIAHSILEYISEKIKCKTLFSTHYHELTKLSDKHDNIKNVHVSAKEENGNIQFLHKIENGPIDKSYGVHVAKLSGMPQEVIENAKIILKQFENNTPILNETKQISLDFSKNEEIEKYISSINLDEISSKEALDILYLLKDMVK